MNITSAHLAAIVAFSLWGLFPIYWKFFPEVEAWGLFAHRLLWSFITLTLFLLMKGRLKGMLSIFKDRQKALLLTISAGLISANWLIYIYAVETSRILEASMGYFLNPLFNMLLGRIILKEKLRNTQWPAILMAILAIVMIGLQADLQQIPWIALVLASTFALYGLIRKMVQVPSLEGLAFETTVVIAPVMIAWFYQTPGPAASFAALPGWKLMFLTLSGLVTCIPLVLFAFGAKRLPLTTLGFIQYLSPSLKFVCGLLIFHEPLSAERLNAFFLIWLALAIYSLESYLFLRRRKHQG